MNKSSGRTTIIVALIGLFSAVLVAVINQWPNIFVPANQAATEVKAEEEVPSDTKAEVGQVPTEKLPIEERPLYGHVITIKYHSGGKGQNDMPDIRKALTQAGAELKSTASGDPRLQFSINGGFCKGGDPWTITYMSEEYRPIAHMVVDILEKCCERPWAIIPGQCEGKEMFIILD